MDAFYAAVEQRDDPALRGKPIVVGGSSKRGVVSTASYEARKFGLKSAMPMVQALRLCPHVIAVPPDFERYQEASSQIMEVFADYSPLVEPLSLDEAFIDMSGAQGLFGSPEKMARQIKADVHEATAGLTVSVGVATSKYVAKVASDFDKPDGLTVVQSGQEKEFLWPMSVSHLWGVGPKCREKVEQMGFCTIGDVAHADKEELTRALGSLGEHIWLLANAVDEREVVPQREAKSVGKEYTLENDVVGAKAIEPHLRRAAEGVARRLRRKRVQAAGVRVKLKTSEFKILTRQAAINPPTDSAKQLLQGARRLLKQFDLRQPMRLVGLSTFNFTELDGPAQGELFTDENVVRERQLDSVMDKIQSRFGDVLKRG